MPTAPLPQADIRDIKDIIPLAPAVDLLTLALGLVVLFLLGVGLFYLLRRFRRPRLEKVRLPHELALAELAKLAAWQLLEQGKDKEFHSHLSQIIRLYVERQFSLPASDRTFDEIKGAIASLSSLSPELAGDLLTILSESDLVKFADYQLSKLRSGELLALTKAFVERTTPKPLVVSKR